LSSAEAKANYQAKLQDTIEKARDLCRRVKDERGLPGLVIGVSVNGEKIWDEGTNKLTLIGYVLSYISLGFLVLRMHKLQRSLNPNILSEIFKGFGYADLENRLKMSPKAVLRIASISKSMTMGMLAKLMEEGKINIDSPIQTYLPNYPRKQVEGKDVSEPN
jgi:serine beta-lactamase-like protein LACTB